MRIVLYGAVEYPTLDGLTPLKVSGQVIVEDDGALVDWLAVGTARENLRTQISDLGDDARAHGTTITP